MSSPPMSGDIAMAKEFEVDIRRYRVGAPAPLPPPSFRPAIHHETEGLIYQFESNFVKKAFETLGKYDVDFHDVDFTVLDRPCPERDPTLLITAEWHSEFETAWTNVVHELKRYIDGELERASGVPSGFQVIVEIIDKRLLSRKFVGPVLENPGLERDWPVIQTDVFSILESFPGTKGAMNCISVFRFGPSQDTQQNPITIFISVDEFVNKAAMDEVMALIETHLWTLPHDLEAHIEHNSVDLCAFETLRPSDAALQRYQPPSSEQYQTQINLGDDIGPNTYIFGPDGKKRHSGQGTLGCYVDVKTISKPEWTTYGLTNYHIVRPCFEGFQVKSVDKPEPGAPRLGSLCKKVDIKGFFPNKPFPRDEMESPSRCTHNLNVHILKEELEGIVKSGGSASQQDTTLSDLQRALDQKLAFFDDGKQVMGTLWMGSGFSDCSPGNHRLDWALVKVEKERQGSNTLPSLSTWIAKYPKEHRPTACGVPLKPANQSIRDLRPGDLVFKVGARTGHTSGTYQRLKAMCRIRHDQHMRITSDEYVFLPHAQQKTNTPPVFANNGDSGAVLYSASGHVLGLLFTGQSPEFAGDGGYALVTPIEDVLEHIVSASDGGITDIRISLS